MGRIISVGLFLSLISFKSSNQFIQPKFDKDAGYIPSFTKFAKILVSSNEINADKILDDDFNTAWQSDAPLPTGFLKKHHQNILLNKGNDYFKTEDQTNFLNATDGDLSSALSIKKSIAIELPQNQYLHSISIKLATNRPIQLTCIAKNGKTQKEIVIPESSNYQLQRIDIHNFVSKVLIKSLGDFSLFEIGALESPPKEFAILDFEEEIPIGQIHTKHWAGDNAVSNTIIYYSNDKVNWEELGSLNPESVHPFILNLKNNITARYLKIEHELIANDWKKCFLWEVNVYDKNGIYGQKPKAQKGSVRLAELLGVNGYWGWGHKAYSELLKKGEGVDLYAPIVSHFRNYHDMTWDISAPDQKMDFKKMSNNKGTPAKDWVNWDREYQTWVRHGQYIQTSLQFFRFKDKSWNNPYQSAFDYASKFAKHYGSTQGNGLVCTMEAGNEPWEYDATTYKAILLGMAKGAKSADPHIEVFPCALQAADPSAEVSGSYKNYMGARLTPAILPYLDGINVHAYSYHHDLWGNRKSVHPEHPNSTFWEVLNAIRWRNENMPNKKIYLSEWGFDSNGGGEICKHTECLDEETAAVYGIRNLLIAARLGIDRATWFFYGNDDENSTLYMRSGLTGSKKTGFKKKKVFFAFQNLLKELGNKIFIDAYQEDEELWGYYFGNSRGEKTHLIIWKPISHHKNSSKKVLISTTNEMKRISNLLNPDSEVNCAGLGTKNLSVSLGSTPLLIEL